MSKKKIRLLVRECIQKILNEDIFGPEFETKREKEKKKSDKIKSDEKFIKRVLGNDYNVYKLYEPIVYAKGLKGNLFPSSLNSKDKKKLGWKDINALSQKYYIHDMNFDKMKNLYMRFFRLMSQQNKLSEQMYGLIMTRPKAFVRIFEPKKIIDNPNKKWVYIVSKEDLSPLTELSQKRAMKDSPEQDKKLKTNTYKRIKDFEIVKETEKAAKIRVIALVNIQEDEEEILKKPKIYYTYADFWVPKKFFVVKNGVLFLERWVFKSFTKDAHEYYGDSIVKIVDDRLEIKKHAIDKLSSMNKAISL